MEYGWKRHESITEIWGLLTVMLMQIVENAFRDQFPWECHVLKVECVDTDFISLILALVFI